MNSIKAVLFDLDGTLLDTLQDIALSMNTVLRQNGFPEHQTDAYRYFVGDGIDLLVKRTLPADKRDKSTIQQCAVQMRQIYGANWSNKTKLYVGIDNLLDKLELEGLQKSILSNKPDHLTSKMVAHYLARWNFKIVIGAQEDLPKKPAPDGALFIAEKLKIPPEQFLYIGDTNTDMITATKAGMYAVGATWGFRTKDELIKNGAKTIIDNPTEIISLFFE